MMTVFHGLFSCNWAALSHKFILLKWSFNWVSHTNKIKKDKTQAWKNNLGLWGKQLMSCDLHRSLGSSAARFALSIPF